MPADYAGLYVRGAATCPGMRPELLAAVGQVESGHGVNTGPSSAGAVGPMQFMPATFAAYAVDGDGDGDVDAQDPADAVFTAAAYLCANGAGKGREAEASAVFRYNHADWYVQMVQRVADELAAHRASGAELRRPCAAPWGAAQVSWRCRTVSPLVVWISTLLICAGDQDVAPLSWAS